MEKPEYLDTNIERNRPDLTAPSFHYNNAEREQMLKEGMTEEEINVKEIEATKKIALNHLKEEMKKAA